MARIAIIDDQPFANRLLAESLEVDEHVVITFDNPIVAGNAASDVRPDLAIIDLLFGRSTYSGLDVLEAYAVRSPSTRCILYTEGGPSRSLELTAAIARFEPAGLVLKDEDSLKIAITAVLNGERHIDPGMTSYMIGSSRGHPDRLVAHEAHLNLWLAMCDGHTTDEELARRTGYSKKYVSNQTAEMRDLLAEMGFVRKAKIMRQDLVGYAVANALFFRNEHRRRTAPRSPAHS